MDIMLLCGYFEPKYEDEIADKTKTWVENAANTFQRRLIEGLKEQDINLCIVSAPFIGPWPTAYKDVWFKGFIAGDSDEDIQYVHFNNVWGYRNISRTAALERCVRDFVHTAKGREKAIIVYCPHTPFLKAAVYGKKLDETVNIHMVVPDLPQYMNLSKKPHPVYDCFKKIDIQQMERLMTKVDSFTLLTKHMAEKLKVGNRPYIVVEGITDAREIEIKKKERPGKKIAYAGKLVESFGVKRLLEAFEMIDDPEAELHICGGGELEAYVTDMCKKDQRIHYYGVVPTEKATEILRNADVLVNPRQNDSEYTKYSFPSKNIEYLMTGNAVVAYMLDGVPEIYREFFIVPQSNKIQSLRSALIYAISEEETKEGRQEKAVAYLKKNNSNSSVVNRMLSLILTSRGCK